MESPGFYAKTRRSTYANLRRAARILCDAVGQPDSLDFPQSNREELKWHTSSGFAPPVASSSPQSIVDARSVGVLFGLVRDSQCDWSGPPVSISGEA